MANKERKNMFKVKDKSLHQACKFKMFPHVVKVILMKLLRMLRLVGMSTIIQQKNQIHRNIKDNVDPVFYWSLLAKA